MFRAAYRVLQAWWFVRRPDMRGVKFVVRYRSEILFVRHTYGDREWAIPGGGVKSGEALAVAATREAQEELGLAIPADRWAHFGEVEIREHATARIGCMVADVETFDGLKLACGEIADHCWGDPEAPPAPLGRNAEQVLALLAAPKPG